MRNIRNYLLAVVCGLASAAGFAQQMTRVVGFEWKAANGDLQRTSWLRVDPNISAQRVSKGDFSLLWREKLDNLTRGPISLSQGVTISGVYGFSTTVSFVVGASNNVFAVDNDTGFPHWRRHFDVSLPATTNRCPGGMTAAAGRVADLVPSPLTIPPPPARGRGYYSAVGLPGEGVPMEIARRDGGAGLRGASAPPPNAAAAPAAPARGGGGAGAAARYTGPVYAVSSDGTLHALGQVSGIDVDRPVPFLPANSRYSDLTAVDGVLYTSTSENCGDTANGVWAITLNDRKVTSWATNGGSPVGQLAFTSSGKIVVAIGSGTSSVAGGNAYTNAMVALDSKTLRPVDWFSNSKGEFATTPVVFSQGGAELVAAPMSDDRVFLLDASALGGADHSTPLFVSQSSGGSIPPEALATFELNGTRWLLVPAGSALTAYKVVGEGKKWALQRGWSRALTAPAAPVVVNDVVFAAASGRPQGSAVLYALDAGSGRELWNSGKTIGSYIPRGTIWASNSQVYVGTYDGTVYAFGPTLERR